VKETSKSTVLEEDEKCGKTWSEVKFWLATESNGYVYKMFLGNERI